MASVEQHTVRDALRTEAHPLVLVRLRWTLYISIAGLVLSASSDLRLSPVPYDLIALKLAGAIAQAGAVLLLSLMRRAPWSWMTGAAVVAYTLAGAIVAVNGSYTADPIMPIFCLPLMVVGASIVFPWGVASQIALTLAAGAILLPEVRELGTNLAVSVYSAFAASVYLAAAFERQQYARKAMELLQAGQQRVLERIAADAPLDTVFAESLETVQEQVPNSMCVILLQDSAARALTCVAARGLPEDYRRAIDSIPLESSLARCVAAAALTGERTRVADIATDTRWAEARQLALSSGLASSWSEPILAADRSVLGMIAIYCRAPHVASERELALLDAASRLLGVALERRAAHEQLERYVGALDDARLQAEEHSVQLAEARDQALASMRARSQFLANMSHEIRTPLNGIIGTTDILLDTELSPTQQEYVRIQSQCGEHLLGVINDILDLSKLEAGKVEIEHVNLDLRALVEDVADLLAMRAQEKGLELVTTIPTALDGTMQGDPSRVRQILMNLAGNAIKFTEHGEVVIEARVLRDAATDCVVRLAVRDTGIGIPADRQAAVFESFTQADGSTTRTHGGSGLGLTISRELVRRMGGTIGLESTPGQGSTFWIELPFERALAAPAAPRLPAISLAGRRVLVVDDTATNRLILRQMLLEWGCRVDEVAGGAEALALLEQRVGGDAVDLVILDMQMPGLDGVGTARGIKANPRLAAVPVILLSSIGGLHGGERAAREIGFAAVISKPVHRATLCDAVCSALGGTVVDTVPRPRVPARPFGQPLGLDILLAEDNRINQLVARRLLEQLGCRVEVAENGCAAVEAVARGRYDVVLMDVQMPLMDGFEATALIRSREAPGEHLPIIAMTAHAMEGDDERCLAAGMDSYLSKPVKISVLAAALAGIEPRATPGHAGARTECPEQPAMRVDQ